MLEFTSSLLIDLRQQIFFLHGLHRLLWSITTQLLPIGLVTNALFAPKKDIVGIFIIDEICPRPLSAAKAYLHKEIKAILCLKLYLPQSDIIEIFLLSLITISLINFGDRFFIESRFGLEELGYYFFFINLFLFPFVLFQSYIGFKEIVSFKLSYNHNLLVQKLKSILKYSILFGIFLLSFSFFVDYLEFYSIDLFENLEMILMLIVLGVVKMVYSLLSSAMGAICDNKMLFKINLYSIISILILIPVIYYYSSTITITIMFLIVLWFIRCVIWYKQLLLYEN